MRLMFCFGGCNVRLDIIDHINTVTSLVTSLNFLLKGDYKRLSTPPTQSRGSTLLDLY